MVVIAKLIDQATIIRDADRRNKAFKYIIQVMIWNPHLRDVLDFQHRYGISFYYVWF
jgi:hypothetical protein